MIAIKSNFPSEITLENESVKLVPLHWEHLEPLLVIAHSHPDLLRYSPSNFGNEKSLRTYFQSAFDQDGRHPFAIFDKRNNEYAGCTSFMNISIHNQRLEIGATWIGKKYQRTGLNKNCKYLLLQYAFEEISFERVELKTDARNKQSRTAILAIGAKYEGELRSHTLMTDGFRRNTVCYSILKNEWPEVKISLSKGLKDKQAES